MLSLHIYQGITLSNNTCSFITTSAIFSVAITSAVSFMHLQGSQESDIMHWKILSIVHVFVFDYHTLFAASVIENCSAFSLSLCNDTKKKCILKYQKQSLENVWGWS